MTSNAPPSRTPTPAPKSADPELLHQLNHSSSVLALAVSKEYIFAGTEDGELCIWSLDTLELVQRIQAHKRSVLSLFLTADQSLLFSCAGDSLVSVWCPRRLIRLCEVYSTYDVGDIFSVAYSRQLDMVYMGAQNTSIQWVCLGDPSNKSSLDSPRHPDHRNHRFFDSKPVGGQSTPRRVDERWANIPRPQTVLEVYKGSILQYAHFGYVYCMLVASGSCSALVDGDNDILISGGGDGVVKLWKLNGPSEDRSNHEHGIEEVAALGQEDAESVMSLAIDGSFLYSGKLQGFIELWDLDTKQKLRVIRAHKGDVMTLQMSGGWLWSASASGTASKHSTVTTRGPELAEAVSQQYQCASRWKTHDGKNLASCTCTHESTNLYITGGSDNRVMVWRANDEKSAVSKTSMQHEDMMIASLREFVSYKTISSRPEFAEDCRKGAAFLRGLFKRLGAHVEVLTCRDEHSSSNSTYNPVVLARFNGKQEPARDRKRILFYGHYDVVVADNSDGEWHTDPFTMSGHDGYLYGRGVTDNKGPIIAALYAVTDLMAAKKLDSDVVFLIEGKEESGSLGFQDIVRAHRDTIGKIDYILLANSYWIDDDIPCLTYGLRGVLHLTVSVESQSPDQHSGVSGSYRTDEPLFDLTVILSKLKDTKNRVQVPRFYDRIPSVSEKEDARFEQIVAFLNERARANGTRGSSKEELMARWREPNVTIHRYDVSGPEGSLVSRRACANVSFRLVPDQALDEVIELVKDYLSDEFKKLSSKNTLTIRVDNKAEPWLGDTSNEIFQKLEEAVMEVWEPLLHEDSIDNKSRAKTDDERRARSEQSEIKKEGGSTDKPPRPGGNLPRRDSSMSTSTTSTRVKQCRPLYIREGGSIPAVRFLEKEFGAPAANLPCGQASDAAHLANERMRMVNLLKSRGIFSLVFHRL